MSITLGGSGVAAQRTDGEVYGREKKITCKLYN
jgi:hypothetical protein